MNLKSFVLIAVLLALPISVFAQTPSEEDMANVDRALAALEAAGTYSSYTVDQSDIAGNVLTITADGEELLKQEESTIEGFAYTLINGENPNISGTGTVIATTIAGETESTSMINAELAVVDGVAYVNATYPVPDASLPALPEGWTAITEADTETYPGLDDLQLDKIFLATEGGPVPFVENFEGFAEAVHASAETVVVGEATLADGSTGEMITISMSGEALGQFVILDEESAANPVAVAISENLSEDSYGLLAVSLDADGNLSNVTLNFGFITTEIDAASLSAELPAGALVVLELSTISTVNFSGINETYTPVEAPAE